jgi:hypothetical protein
MIIVFAYEMTTITPGLRQMSHRRLSKDGESGHRVSKDPRLPGGVGEPGDNDSQVLL